ncbi:antibiotic biosynthesis monooxygenase [Vagococcus sp. DIV0080]|uniref:Antibiotic biosynthesis monooxygenase n=1 Tax=Candidatus Vagococcus giribetii TaxID=2230876 RepID=A0ABS3HRQ1_9ENTE|nr:antibiotic biosynthesis monooxygenase [Vagococcus sp. DIV0080]MBO0475985.1 antibiotic biosynthesis monooxygenase [Vagococcus sp. DIV0080]
MTYLKEDYLYCTAILQSTKKVPYEQLIKKLEKLQEKTTTEKGCILFEVVPLNRELERFGLWEIWKDTESFYKHHEKEYTKEFFAEQLDTIELFESSKEVSL